LGIGGAAEKSDLSRRQFAANRIMLEAIRTGFTFRFREWLRRSDKASNILQADRYLAFDPPKWPGFPTANFRSG
jgi:hypothetical protein